eukprot:5917078-Amphidinium_carterae.1
MFAWCSEPLGEGKCWSVSCSSSHKPGSLASFWSRNGCQSLTTELCGLHPAIMVNHGGDLGKTSSTAGHSTHIDLTD